MSSTELRGSIMGDICADCGAQFGKHKCGLATWHMGYCAICGRYKAVTEPRDFGGLREGEGWRVRE
jgi:hypothetical protein